MAFSKYLPINPFLPAFYDAAIAPPSLRKSSRSTNLCDCVRLALKSDDDYSHLKPSIICLTSQRGEVVVTADTDSLHESIFVELDVLNSRGLTANVDGSRNSAAGLSALKQLKSF